jgi:hypothetical protein
MDNQNGAVVPMPAWLLERCIAVAAELERMHGAQFAAAFLNDIGVTPEMYSHIPPAKAIDFDPSIPMRAPDPLLNS